MKVQKYIDMAYNNPRGLEWINLLHRPDIWPFWSKRVQEHTKPNWFHDTDRPEKIFTAAIWHFGYARDSLASKALRKTAFRLRRGDAPRERGAGASKRGDFETLGTEMILYGMPLEFWLLDNFLEHEIRPLMDTSTKSNG